MNLKTINNFETIATTLLNNGKLTWQYKLHDTTQTRFVLRDYNNKALGIIAHEFIALFVQGNFNFDYNRTTTFATLNAKFIHCDIQQKNNAFISSMNLLQWVVCY
jgi:hypothetical protein